MSGRGKSDPVTLGGHQGDYFGEPLTPAEHEVMGLVCRGFGNAEIAEARFTARGTAKTQVERILAKLGARNRIHAVAIYLSEGGPYWLGAPRAFVALRLKTAILRKEREGGSPRDERKARER